MFKKLPAAPHKWGFQKDVTTNFDKKITMPINIDSLQSLLQDHPDTQSTEYLMNGLRFGFHTGFQDLPKNSLECKNLKSASLNSDSVTEIVNKELNLGYLYGPFSEIPFRHYRINPIGIAESKYSKKKRLIVDMSAPHNDEENPSMNTLQNSP